MMFRGRLVVLAMTVLCFNIIGDTLSEKLEPKLS